MHTYYLKTRLRCLGIHSLYPKPYRAARSAGLHKSPLSDGEDVARHLRPTAKAAREASKRDSDYNCHHLKGNCPNVRGDGEYGDEGRRRKRLVGWLVGCLLACLLACLTSQQHASVSQKKEEEVQPEKEGQKRREERPKDEGEEY